MTSMTVTDLSGARRHARHEGYPRPELTLRDVDPIVTTSFLVVLESALIRLAKQARDSHPDSFEADGGDDA